MSVKRVLTSFVILLFLPLLSFAIPNVLKGKVTDTKGMPLAGAIVELLDLKTGTVTDTGGRYVIKDLPRGSYLVQVHEISFSTLSQTVKINGATHQDFKLSESIIENSEVVVTGTSLATEERKSITPIESIGAKQIHENAYSNVIDAIAKLPGVSELTTGPAVSKPFIRGLGYNRIITLNDGVRQEGQQWGDEHGIEIDDYDVSRIEVLKGPASLAYGSDALAGVVNILSTQPLPEGKIQGSIVANYQSNNGLGALHGDLGGNENGFSWNIYATQKDAHDYHDKYDGYVYDTRFRNTDFGVSGGVNKKWGSSTISYTLFNQHLGIPEGSRDSATGQFTKEISENGVEQTALVTPSDNHDYNMVISYQHVNHQKIVWNNELYLNNGGRLGLILAYQQNIRMEFNDPTAFTTPGLSLLLHSYTYDLKYYFPVWHNWQVTTGINGMEQINQNRGTEFLIPDYNLFDIGGYGIASRKWTRWEVSGGVRYDFRTITGQQMNDNTVKPPYDLFSGFTRNYNDVSGSVGAGYNIDERTTLKFNVASGYRTPNIAELSANGVHDGTARYEYGNTDLKPEHSTQADLGLTWSSKHVLVNAAIFDNYIKDFIFIRKLQSVSGGDSIPVSNNYQSDAAYIYNQSDANLYGAELYVDLHPHPLDWLHFENTLSYVRGMFVNPTSDTTRNLPYIPPFRWLVELRAQKKSISNCIKNAYVKVGLDINSAQNNIYSAYGTETPTPGYTLLNAGIGTDFVNKKGHTLCTLTVAGNNLTDVAYQSNLSRLKYLDENNVTGRVGIFNMGRNVSVTLSVPLDIK